MFSSLETSVSWNTALPPFSLQSRHRALATLAIEIGDHDCGAFACESNCGSGADSARCTRNDGNLLFEFTHKFFLCWSEDSPARSGIAYQ
jgi:hypothetical protein